MLSKKFATFILSLLVVFLTTGSVLACACCVEPGHYSRSRVKLDKSHTELLHYIKITGVADLYLTAAGFDAIKGLPEIEKLEAEGSRPEFRVTSSFDRRNWRISAQAAGQTGALVLAMPAHITLHAADIDGVDTGLGVSLYKEYGLNGRVTAGTGIFRTARAANYHLMFQGRGNGCDNASDFTRWRLEINGPRVNYAFFGKTE
jgi:hypothetical protein